MAKHFSRILPVGFGFVLLLFIFWPLFAGFTFWANGISYSDFWLFNFPLKDWYRSLLLQGELPFWTSLLGNGYPVFAEGQIGALYPFNLLFFRLFPTVLAINLTLFFHFFLAFFLTFLFCRVSLKLSQSAAFLAGLTFSLSGYFWIHIQYTNVLLVISWLPLVFLSIERIVMTKRFFWTFILALIFSLQILAGHLEFFLYSFLLSIFYFLLINFLFRGKDQARPALSLFLFAGAVILSIGITLVQTLPTYELTKESNRAGGFDVEYASSTSWPPKTLSFFLSPQFYDHFQREQEYHPFKDNFVNPNALYGYIGFLPIVLAILAMVLARKRFVAIFTILLFLAFIYGLGRQTQVFEILWQTVPGLKMLRFPVKILFFIEFCLAVLAGLGLDYLKGKISGKFKKITKIGLILGTTIVLATAADLYFNNAGRFSKFTKTDQWLQAPPTAQFLKENLGQNYRYYTQSTNNLFAPGSDFTLHKSFQNILPVNFNLIYKIPSNREYFTLFLSRQKEIENQRTAFDSQRGKLELTQKFKKALDLQSVRYLVMDLPLDDPDLILINKYPFSKEVGHSIFFSDGRTEIVPSNFVYLYENSRVYPRVLWVQKATIVQDDKEVLEKVLGEDFNPAKEVILEGEVERAKWEEGSKKREVGITEIQEDTGNEVKIRVEAENDGFLVLADTYYPGWQAEIDGRPAEILRANYNFRAVAVPGGNHTVSFSFLPSFWKESLVISLSFALFTLTGIFLTWRLTKEKVLKFK